MKIFADANLFIDVQRKRGNWNASYSVLKTVIDGTNEGFISALTPAIIYFLRQQITSESKSRQETKDAIEGFKIIDLTDPLLRSAIDENRVEGLEDAIQFLSAKQFDCVFITRNKKDFREAASDIQFFTPEEFLEQR